ASKPGAAWLRYTPWSDRLRQDVSTPMYRSVRVRGDDGRRSVRMFSRYLTCTRPMAAWQRVIQLVGKPRAVFGAWAHVARSGWSADAFDVESGAEPSLPVEGLSEQL